MDRRISRRRARAALARVVRNCTDAYRPLAENLEDRTLLSVNSSFAAGALVLTFTGTNNDTITIQSQNTAASDFRISAAAGTTLDGTAGNSETFNVVASITVTGSAATGETVTFDTNSQNSVLTGGISLADIDVISLTDSTGSGSLKAASFSESGGTNATTTLNRPLLTTGAAGVSITDDTSITVNSTVDASAAATGSVTLTATQNITVGTGSGGSIKTSGGGITLSANEQATATAGNFVGVIVNASTVQATGSGVVSVSGRGGDDAFGTQSGVLVENGGVISGGTTGTTVVSGTAGNSTGDLNTGVVVISANSKITSAGSDVSVTGVGNGSGSGSSNYGVEVDDGGTITAGSAGAVTVMGSSIATDAGGGDEGVFVSGSNSAITSAGGDVSVTGTPGGGPNSLGVAIDASTTVSSGGTANLAITTDSLSVDSTATIKGGAAGNSIVTLQPNSGGLPIDLGGSGSGSRLRLTQAELARVTAGILRIGSLFTGGSITVTAPISAPAGWSTLSLLTEIGAGISQNAGATLTVTNLQAAGNTGVALNQNNVVSTLAGATDFGAFSFVDSTNLTVDAVDSGLGFGFGVGIITDGQDVNLTVNGSGHSLTVNQHIDATHNFGVPPAAGNIVLQADGSIAVSAAIQTTGTGTITLTADHDNTGGDSLTTNAGGKLSTGGGNITIKEGPAGAGETGPITIGDTVTITGGSGSVSVSSGDNDNVNAAVSVTGTGGIGITNDANNNFTGDFNSNASGTLSTHGGNITIQGGTTGQNGNNANIGGAITIIGGAGSFLVSEASDIHADAAISVTGTGGIGIIADSNQGGFGSFFSNASGTLSTHGGGIALTDISPAQNSVSNNATVGGAITITGGSGSVTFTNNTSIAVNAAISVTGTGGINMTADADANGNGTFTNNAAGTLATTGGKLAISAVNITLAGTVNATTNPGSIVTLKPSTTAAVIHLGNTTAFGLTDAELDLVTASVLRIGVASNTGGINIAGSITQAGSGYNTLSLITGSDITQGAGGSLSESNLALQAVAGIGSGGAIQVVGPVNVAFRNTGSNNVQIDSTGAMTIGAVDTLDASAGHEVANPAAGGTVALTASSPIAFAVNTSSSGTLSATTTETATETTTQLPSPDDDITVNGGVTVESTGGDVDFTAGDSIVTQAGSVLKSDSGTVSLTAGMGDVDNDASLTLNGTINAVNLTLSSPGNVVLGQISLSETTGTLTVISTGGSIRDDGDDSTFIEAHNINLTAAKAIGGDTQISRNDLLAQDATFKQAIDYDLGAGGTLTLSQTGAGGNIQLRNTDGTTNTSVLAGVEPVGTGNQLALVASSGVTPADSGNAAGDLVVDAALSVGANNDNLLLAATDGNNVSVSHTVTNTGTGTVALVVGGTAAGASGGALNVNAAVTAVGSISLAAAGNAAGDGVFITANVTASGSGATISVDANRDVNVTGINTTLATTSATGGAITVTSAEGLPNFPTGGTGVVTMGSSTSVDTSANNSTITVDAGTTAGTGGDITAAVLNANTGAVNVKSFSGSIVDGNASANNVTGGAINLSAGGAAGINLDVITSTPATAGVVATTISGNITLRSTQQLQVDSISAGTTNDVSLSVNSANTAVSSITSLHPNDNVADVTGQTVTLTATGPTTGNAGQIGFFTSSAQFFEVSATTLNVSTNNSRAWVAALGGAAVGSVNIGTNTIFLRTENGTLTSTHTGSTPDIIAAAVNLSQGGPAGSFGTQTNPLLVQASLLTAAISFGTGSINVTNVAAGGSLTVSRATTVGGDINIATAGGNLFTSGAGFGVPAADIVSPGGTVTLASSGAVLTGTPASVLDVSAKNLAITAVNGIGTMPNPLKTAVTNLAFKQTGAPPVDITNTGALTINAVGTLLTSNAGGPVILQAASPMTFAVNTTSAAALTATTADNSGFHNDNITVNTGVTVASTVGDVVFDSGDDVVINGTVQSQFRDVDLVAGFADTDGEGVISINGTVSAVATVTLNVKATNTALGAGTPIATETAGGTISAAGLLLLNLPAGAPGPFNLNASTTNAVGTIAGSTHAAINFSNSAALTVGSVTSAAEGVTAFGIGTTGNDVTLVAAGNLTINQPVDAGSATGAITLTPTGGDVTDAAAGALTGKSITQTTGTTSSSYSGLVTAGIGGVSLTGNSFSLLGNFSLTTGSLTVNDTGVSILSGTVSGSGGLIKKGSGSLSVSVAETYTGTTVVNAGTLNVNGSLLGAGLVSVTGGVLGGTGSVGTINATGGTVKPGLTGPGILTAAGSTTFSAATTFQVALNGNVAGTGYSQLLETGSTVNLGNATLAGTLGYSPSPADELIIVHHTGSGATFGDFAQGGTVTIGGKLFSIDYGFAADADGIPNDVALITFGAAVIPDPGDPTKTALIVTGTGGDDNIQILGANGNNRSTAVINGMSFGPFSPTGHIIVLGLSGNDTITVDKKVNIPALLFGGSGNDAISSGNGPAVEVGGSGNDTLLGANNSDILIGGTGADLLKGDNGSDILIGGSTSYDSPTLANENSLILIQNEWDTGNYPKNVAHILNGGGLNGSNVFNNTTVFDDAAVDSLFGGNGQDWFLLHGSGPNADVSDATGSETKTLI
jgi:hypothetical protein